MLKANRTLIAIALCYSYYFETRSINHPVMTNQLLLKIMMASIIARRFKMKQQWLLPKRSDASIMAIDGTFIHYLTDELSSILKGGRVQKVNQLNNLEFIFEVRSGGANHRLLISSALNAPRIHLTKTGDIPISEPQRLGLFLKKNLERAVISDLSQIGNDRCIKIEFDTTDDLARPNVFGFS